MRPNLRLFDHQAKLFSAPWNPQAAGIDYFFMVAGYASGKSFADCALILNLIRRYHGHEVSIGIGGVSQMFLSKTLLLELFRMLDRQGIPYEVNRQSGVITVDRMTLFCIGLENPGTIYGYNLSVFIADELDELPPTKALEAAQAISERTRIPLPDGRLPFQVYSSTAQGYRGLYTLYSTLKEKGEKLVLIRGETRINTLIPREKYESWYRQYNELEREAYLFGKFVNLTTGRVYPSFDESRNMLKAAPFVVEPNDLIRVGQDFNAGYSRGAATVTRSGVIHVVKIFAFPEIAHAAKIIRTAFPANVIEWYPDASSYEVVKGYAEEVRAMGIATWVGTINPSVIDRIFFVNRLLEMGKLVLWPNTGPLAMALKIRQFNEHGDPEKRQGANDPSHYCDSLEYVVWRIVCRDPEFSDLWGAGRIGRREILDRIVA